MLRKSNCRIRVKHGNRVIKKEKIFYKKKD
jgi:hypothetical protein